MDTIWRKEAFSVKEGLAVGLTSIEKRPLCVNSWIVTESEEIKCPIMDMDTILTQPIF